MLKNTLKSFIHSEIIQERLSYLYGSLSAGLKLNVEQQAIPQILTVEKCFLLCFQVYFLLIGHYFSLRWF